MFSQILYLWFFSRFLNFYFLKGSLVSFSVVINTYIGIFISIWSSKDNVYRVEKQSTENVIKNIRGCTNRENMRRAWPKASVINLFFLDNFRYVFSGKLERLWVELGRSKTFLVFDNLWFGVVLTLMPCGPWWENWTKFRSNTVVIKSIFTVSFTILVDFSRWN